MLKFQNKKIENLALPLSKIIIIFVVSFFIVGFFFPYYDYPNDSREYGVYAIRLAGGEYEFSSELLSDTGKDEFLPANWIKTARSTGIPDAMPGMAALGAIFYKIGGDAGLFYLGPVFAISFLIVSERIATRFFGSFVGLLTLCFLATNEIFFWVGRGLLSSNIFSLLFIIGFYFLIQFLLTKKHKLLFFSSLFFMSTVFFRLNGIIIFPVEIGIIAGYFIIKYFYQLKNKDKNETKTLHQAKEKKNKNILKILVCILIPWTVFFGFFMIFNDYYFDDPTTSIYTATDNPRITLESEQDTKYTFDIERIKKYLNHFLPYPINRIGDITNNETNVVNEFALPNFLNIFSNYHLGIITLMIMIISIIYTIKKKENRTLVISSSLFILFFILFYSFEPIAETRQGSGRDILPTIPLFYMMLSYVIVKIIKNSSNYSKKGRILSYFPRIGAILFLILIIPIAFFFADYSQILKNEGLVFKNPNNFYDKFPVDFEGIPKESVIVTYFQKGSVLVYGAIPFTPTWDENSNELHYQKLSTTLKETISGGNQVYIFKDPKYDEEKKFYEKFFSKNDLILKNYSDSFCQILIDEYSEMKNDKECLE